MSENEFARMVARNLKRIAYENGKTQADIASDLKISKQTVSSWMTGARVPRMDKIDLLCHYFNCQRVDIMEDEPSPRYYINAETAAMAQKYFDHPEYRVLFDAAEGASPENIQLAAEMLKRMKATNPEG